MSTSYDEVPYHSRPFYACHPDCLAVMGTLLGLEPAPPARSRVLEIGCASAGNLIPMALQYPAGQFVGIDLSPVQIGLGNQIVRDLGVENLDLRAVSLTDIDASWGTFDYILCHGVYSWVPDFVRAKILEIARTNLAPRGIAYISYNTYPGWFARKTLRDIMNYHVRRIPEPRKKVAQAREMLEFLDRSGLPADSPSSQTLRELIRDLRDVNDYYLFHEYLEDENHPFYFHEFMADAQRAGLQYLGNAWHHIDLDLLGADAKQTLLQISEDIVQLEQFADFLTNRPFRRSLLCHAERSLDRNPPAEVVSRLHVAALAEPVSANPDCYSDAPESFTVRDKRRGTTDQPLTKTLFVALAELWPDSIAFEDLWTIVRGRLAEHGCLTPALADQGREALAQTLLQAYLGNFASLHMSPFSFVRKAGPRPRGSRLARWQVDHDYDEVSNLRHAVVKLERVDRIILPLFDGDRSREEIRAALADRVSRGQLSFTQDDGSPLAGDDLNSAIEQTVANSLDRLGRQSLLEA